MIKVKDARIIGLIFGLILGGTLAEVFDGIVIMIGIIGVVAILSGKQILKGQIGGLLVGISAGYFLRALFFLS